MAQKKGMFRGELTPVARELAALLRRRVWDSSEVPLLLDAIATLVPDDLDPKRALRAEIRDLLDDELLHAEGSEHGRLLAARWLFRLKEYTPADAIRDMGPYAQYTKPKLSAKTFAAVGTVQRIACAALMREEGDWRGDIRRTYHNMFGGPSGDFTPRTRDVAAKLDEEFERRLERLRTDSQFRAGREAVWREPAISASPARSAEPEYEHDPLTLLRIEALQRLPRYFPAHLSISDLVADQRVRELKETDDRDLRESEEDSVPAVSMSKSSRRIVLLGDPGSGKSTLSRALAIEELTQPRLGEVAFVPANLLADAALADRSDVLRKVSELALLAAVSDPAPTDVEAFMEKLENVDALVIVDGLDEVFSPEAQLRLDHALATLEALPARLLVTSRSSGFRRRKGWTHYQLLPLRNQFPTLIKVWYPDPSSPARNRALDAYASGRQLRNLARSAVLAGFLAKLADDPSADLGGQPSRLYEQVIGLLCARQWKAPHQPARSEADAARLRLAYDEAAWMMAVGSESPDAMHWTGETSYMQLTAAGLDAERLKSGELLAPYGAPEVASEVHRPWSWLHQTFAEFLVGARLLVEWRSGQSHRLFEQALQIPTWSESLAFMLEQASEQERADVLDFILGLCQKGDPGAVIAARAMHLFGDYPHERNRLMVFVHGNGGTGRRVERLRAPNDVNAPKPNSGLAPWLIHDFTFSSNPGAAKHALWDLVIAAGGAGLQDDDSGILDSHEFRGYLLQQIRDLSWHSTEVKVAAFESLIVRDTVLASFLWDDLQSTRFPATLPIARAMGAAYVENERSQTTDDELLTLWALDRIPGERESSSSAASRVNKQVKNLIGRVLRGEWGTWAAFNVGMLSPNLLAGFEAACGMAHLGARLKRFWTDPWDDHPDARQLSDEVVCDAIEAFLTMDTEDELVYLNLVDALIDCDGARSEQVLSSLLRLGSQLHDELGLADLVTPPRLAFSTRDLRVQIQSAVREVLESFDSRAIFTVGMSLRNVPRAVRPHFLSLVRWINFRFEESPRLVFDLVEWFGEEFPESLDSLMSMLRDLDDERHLAEVIRRGGAGLTEAANFYGALVSRLETLGVLPKWRSRLIGLENQALTLRAEREGAAWIYLPSVLPGSIRSNAGQCVSLGEP